ncbi:hypothetical protein [Leptospira interrogans]|uniref:hypothetical protein n=1 Tax=Leptospira interrogans TaxID=173 RepID=UPI000773981C|nr:hypothetical protein [Leptospira interrogans]
MTESEKLEINDILKLIKVEIDSVSPLSDFYNRSLEHEIAGYRLLGLLCDLLEADSNYIRVAHLTSIACLSAKWISGFSVESIEHLENILGLSLPRAQEDRLSILDTDNILRLINAHTRNFRLFIIFANLNNFQRPQDYLRQFCHHFSGNGSLLLLLDLINLAAGAISWISKFDSTVVKTYANIHGALSPWASQEASNEAIK